jgi:hypothetical protein
VFRGNPLPCSGTKAARGEGKWTQLHFRYNSAKGFLPNGSLCEGVDFSESSEVQYSQSDPVDLIRSVYCVALAV